MSQRKLLESEQKQASSWNKLISGVNNSQSINNEVDPEDIELEVPEP